MTGYQRHTQPVPVEPGDWAAARAHAAAAMARHADTPHNRLWTPEQLAAAGYLAEIAFRRYLGLPLALPTDPTEGAPDVGRIQVKAAIWLSPGVMDRQAGGHVFVPLGRCAPVLALVTMFPATMARRVFYEGWMPTHRAAGYPVQPGHRPARAVPYSALNPPWLPLPGAALTGAG